MSDNNGAKMQRSNKIAEIIGNSTGKTSAIRKEAEVEDTRASNIASNPFYKIIADAATTPEDKTKAVASLLTNVSNETESKAAIENLEQVKEYLQLQRENMAGKIIELTDTDTIARLQQVYTDMNNGLLLFNEDLQPILDIVDAMHIVRKEGKTNEIFAEIRKDRKGEEELNSRRADLERQFSDTKNEIENLRAANAALTEKKGFFGFGNTTTAAREQIAKNEFRIDSLTADLRLLEEKVKSLQNANPVETEEVSEEYSKAKKTIRKMLDLNSQEHKDNQKRVVSRASEFVKTSKESLGAIRGHIVGMNEQINRLSNANYSMTNSYAILGEGIKEAAKEVADKKSHLSTAAEGESMIARLAKEKEMRIIDSHSAMLQNSATDTELTFADLSNQGSRIRTMSDANTNQMEKVKKLHVTGVASVADQLSVVLQAVGQAALGESSAIAKDTLGDMMDRTNEISFKESMRVAYMSQEVNEDIVKAFEGLSAYGEITRAATEVTRNSVEEMRENLDLLNKEANNLQRDLKAQAAVYSDVASTEKKQVEEVSETKAPDPFSI